MMGYTIEWYDEGHRFIHLRILKANWPAIEAAVEATNQLAETSFSPVCVIVDVTASPIPPDATVIPRMRRLTAGLSPMIKCGLLVGPSLIGEMLVRAYARIADIEIRITHDMLEAERLIEELYAVHG